MSKLSNNSSQNLLKELNNHGDHHTTTHSKLDIIATNTANIKLSTDSVNLNVDTLEALQQTTINHLDGVIGHINNTNAIGSGQNVVKSMSLGYDRGNDKGVAILVDSAGHVQTDIVSAALPSGAATSALQGDMETSLDAILAMNTLAEAHVGNIDGNITACNTGAVVISSSALPSGAATSALQGDMETSLDAILAMNTLAEAHVGNIDGNITACNTGAVVISSSALPSGAATQTTLAAAEVHVGNIDGKITACNTGAVVLAAGSNAFGKLSANSGVDIGDVDVLSLPLTFNSGSKGATTQRVVIATDDIPIAQVNTHLNTISGDTTSLDGKVTACNTGAVVISSSALPSGAATQTTLAAAEVHLGNIDTGVDVLEACVGSNKVNVNIASNAVDFATQTTLAAAEAHLGNIDTGVDVLEACVGSNKVNVNISSGNITGFATQTTLAAAEVHLGNIETAVQLIDDAIKTEDLAHSSGDKGIPCLMVRQDSHTDLAADGDYMIPTINANGEIRVTSTAASGGATEAKQDDMETTLDAILAKNTEIETTNNANQVLLGTIDSDTDAIKSNTAALVVDLAAIEVLSTAANALLTTIDSDTNDIKTAVELNSGARVHTNLNFGDIAVGGGAAETLPAGTGLTLNNSSAKLGYVCSAEVDADYQFIIQHGLTDAGGTTTFVDHVVSGSSNLNGGTRQISGVIDKIGKFARVKILNTSASGTQSFTVNLFQ